MHYPHMVPVTSLIYDGSHPAPVAQRFDFVLICVLHCHNTKCIAVLYTATQDPA